MTLDMMLFGGAAAALSAGCLVPNRWLPRLPNDKLLHFAGFAVLSVLALRAAGSGTPAWPWLLGLLAGGWVIECLQSLVPGRAFCWRDLAANAAGIAAGSAAVQLAGLF